MKAVVAAFNQEKVLVGAFSVITNLRMELFEALVCILTSCCSVMLMYGSAKNSRWLILPWLVATFLFILAYIAGMILSTHLFGVSLLSIAFLAIAIIEVASSETSNTLCRI